MHSWCTPFCGPTVHTPATYCASQEYGLGDRYLVLLLRDVEVDAEPLCIIESIHVKMTSSGHIVGIGTCTQPQLVPHWHQSERTFHQTTGVLHQMSFNLDFKYRGDGSDGKYIAPMLLDRPDNTPFIPLHDSSVLLSLS